MPPSGTPPPPPQEPSPATAAARTGPGFGTWSSPRALAPGGPLQRQRPAVRGRRGSPSRRTNPSSRPSTTALPQNGAEQSSSTASRGRVQLPNLQRTLGGRCLRAPGAGGGGIQFVGPTPWGVGGLCTSIHLPWEWPGRSSAAPGRPPPASLRHWALDLQHGTPPAFMEPPPPPPQHRTMGVPHGTPPAFMEHPPPPPPQHRTPAVLHGTPPGFMEHPPLPHSTAHRVYYTVPHQLLWNTPPSPTALFISVYSLLRD